jgi:hypothetical protein
LGAWVRIAFDVMLAQKIAFETFESGALLVANGSCQTAHCVEVFDRK